MIIMKWQEIDQHWKQFEDVVKYRWQKLTNKELNQIDGNKESLNVKLQRHYKQNREEANKSIDEFLGTFHGILLGKSSVTKAEVQTNSDLADPKVNSDLIDTQINSDLINMPINSNLTDTQIDSALTDQHEYI